MKDKTRTENLRRAKEIGIARKKCVYQDKSGDVRSGKVQSRDWGDLELFDRKAKKKLKCNGLFHPCASVVRLHLKRCKEGED